MKKREPAKTLYPKKETITFKNFIFEDGNLLILIILTSFIFFFILWSFFAADFFRAENFYTWSGITGLRILK